MMILQFLGRQAMQPLKIEPVKPMSTGLYITADFRTSGVLLQTDCVLLTNWFLVIMGIVARNRFFMWLQRLNMQSYNCLNYLYATFYIWFKTANRKPPDKISTQPQYNDRFRNFLYTVEDAILYLFKTEVNICFWTSFILHQLSRCHRSGSTSKILAANADKYLHEQRSSHEFSTNAMSIIPRYVGKTLLSNVAISYAAQPKHASFIDETYTFDEDSYQFIVDTGTTFHVCKERELFTGSINKARHIYIKGMGGRIKVRGYGTIKIRVVDDMNDECDLIITNVLYVPESPTNLLSPQLWSELSAKPSGTGEITVGGTTILFWDGNSHTKTITHHPHIKLPMFHANRGRTMTNLLFKGSQEQPQIPQSLHTSVSMVATKSNGENITH